MTLYQDTRSSYYTVLLEKLNQDNEKFTMKPEWHRDRCYIGEDDKHWSQIRFIPFVESETARLSGYLTGKTVEIDESIFIGFPQKRPAQCMLQDDILKQEGHGSWGRNFYFDKKRNDYNRIKKEIDLILLPLKEKEEQEIIQNITFKEQKNSGDFNETPITDVNLSGGCSECTEPEHQMPDGSMMKDSEMKKSNVGVAGIAAFGIIGLLLYSKGGLK